MKWQWNKAGALLNFQSYIQALKLSTTSFGFTQEQVGMQMDTLARRIEGLKQAFINLTTSAGGGALSSVLKGIISLLTGLLNTLNAFHPETLGLLIVTNIFLAKLPALISGVKAASEAIIKFGKSFATAGSLAAKANIIVGIINALYVAATALGVFDTEQDEAAKGAEELNKKLEAQTELFSRQAEGDKMIDKMVEAYDTLTKQMQELDSSSDEYKTRLEERNDVEAILVNILGEQQEQELKNRDFSAEAIQEIKDKRTQAHKTLKDQIKDTRDALAAKAQDMAKWTNNELAYIEKERNGWGALAAEMFALGYPLQAIKIWFWDMAEASAKALAAVFDGINHLDMYIRDSAFGKALRKIGVNIDGTLGNSSYSFFMQLASDAMANKNAVIDNVENDMQQQLYDKFRSIGMTDSGSYGGSFDPLAQTPLGGSQISDDAGSGSGKGSKGSRSSSSTKPTGIGGIELTIPNEDNYLIDSGVDISPFSQDLRTKMRVLDDWFYKYTAQTYGQGQHFTVSSGNRPDDTDSNHGYGHAFDVRNSLLDEHPELTQALASMASYVGLFSINEYPNEAGDWVPHSGSNVHFSDVKPGQLSVTRDSEGLWSQDNAAPSIWSILGGGQSGGYSYVDNSPQRQLYDTIRSLGGMQRTDQQVWGAMASIGYESAGFNPAAVQGGGTDPQVDNLDVGIGLMQWSGSRKKAYLDFAAERGKPWYDLGTQLAFIQEEYNNGSERQSWDNYFGEVNGNAWNDVSKFTSKVERADPNYANIDGRVKQYYWDVSSHYANGMSVYDSNPSKSQQKQKTPEELAKERADSLQKYFDGLNKGLDNLNKITDEKYKATLDSVAEDQKYFGVNIDNTTKQLNAYSNQIADTTDVSLQYHKAIQSVSSSINPEEFKRYANIDLNDFFDADLQTKQKMLATIKNSSQLYAPIKAQLNEVITLTQKLQEVENKIHKQRMEWADTEAKFTLGEYDTEVKNYQDIIDEYNAIHSNDTIDEFNRNDYTQQYLEEQARLLKQKYEQAQEIIRDAEGHPIKDSEGNERRYGGTPEQIEQTRLAWLKADAAAKQYAATLKNDVKKNMADVFASIFVDGKKASDILKDLWQQLGHDAWQLLITGKGTDSPLGNFLRSLMVGKRQSTVQDMSNAGFGYTMPEVSAWREAYMQPYSFGGYDWRTASMRRVVGQAEIDAQQPVRGVSLEAYSQPTQGVNLDAASKQYDTATALQTAFTPMNPMPVQVMNLPSVGGGTAGNLANTVQQATESIKDYLPKPDMNTLSAFSNLPGQQPDGSQLRFATNFNWGTQAALPAYGAGAPGGSGWGSMALASKIGLIGMGLPLLFSLFKHHASGGEIDNEEIAFLGEGNKKEYVIPTEQNRPRGVALWQKAGQDLGILSKGTKIAPDFKNKEIAQNGVVSASVRQQAVYMDEMRQQNKTLLNILAFMANNQANGSDQGSGATIVQPVVMKQDMDINSFTKMYQKGKTYNYIK